MVAIIIALIITMILTIISLFFIYFLLRRVKTTHAKKLFYFDLFRLILRFSVVQFLLIPILISGSLPDRIFNPQNASLPPPGIASVQDWLMWWFGYPLLEFSQSEAAVWADLSLILIHKSAAFLIPITLLTLTLLDYLWSYHNLKFAKYIRTINYSIWLVAMIVWTFYALAINPDFLGAQDYRNKWLFMQYWGFSPWVVVVVVFGLIFSLWTTTIVIGYLIYKAWKED